MNAIARYEPSRQCLLVAGAMSNEMPLDRYLFQSIYVQYFLYYASSALPADGYDDDARQACRKVHIAMSLFMRFCPAQSWPLDALMDAHAGCHLDAPQEAEHMPSEIPP